MSEARQYGSAAIDHQGDQGGGQAATRISRRWLTKMIVIAAALLGFGAWGLYDALVAYPARGARAAERAELDYLEQYVEYAATNPLARRDVAIKDAPAELERLRQTKDTLPSGEALAPLDRTAVDWLEQLERIGRLDAATATDIPRTDFRGDEVADFRSRVDALRQKWTTTDGGMKKANPLSRFDIPSQWLITAVGFVGGAWILALIARVSTKTYRWEPAEQRLILPGGASLTPADVSEVDKTLWHKYYVELVVKPGHSQLGGKSVKLDLMRYEPLEEWVLEMEKTIHPETAQPAAAAAETSDAAATANA